MSPRTRMVVLLGLLAGSAALVLSDDQTSRADNSRVVRPRETSANESGASKPPSAIRLADSGKIAPMILEIHGRTTVPPGGAFGLRNWNPPPPPPPPPAPPVAPPLPFTFLGKKLEDGAWRVFLARQDRTYIVGEQDGIEGIYRVEAITPPTMTLTYLPMQQRQTLAIGDN